MKFSAKTSHVRSKTEIHFIAQDHSYTQELSMHSVSTDQYEQVWRAVCPPCDVTIIKNGTYRGHQLGGHDLELFPLLARCLLGLVVWYRCLVATFGGCSKQFLTDFSTPPSPMLHFTHPPPCYAGVKLVPTSSQALKSSYQPFIRLTM